MMKLLVLLAGIAYGLIALARLRERWMSRLRSLGAHLPPPQGYDVTIETPGGRAGWIEYGEHGERCRFGWELLGGGRSVLYVMVPGPEQWDSDVPWARGRRQQILARVAEEVVRQKCPSCRWELDDEQISFHTA
jgi:hypothetical protein